MARNKVLKKRSSGCCWRKLLEKTLKRDPNLARGPNKAHQCFDQDEIVYLNLYLTSLEKKMQAIEEITRLKWYQKQMLKTNGNAQNFIGSGFKYFKDDACKTLLPTMDDFSTGLSTISVTPQKPTVQGSSEAIIREIMSLGSKNYHQDYESRKWAALLAPQQDPIITEPDKIIEINDEMPEGQSMIYSAAHMVVSRYHVAAMSYPCEAHVATHKEEASVLEPTRRIKASCTIDFFDNEAKTIEITYNNRDWDKKGTIVLRDIENQIGVQTELIGRVVCFLLGMAEVNLVEEQ